MDHRNRRNPYTLNHWVVGSIPTRCRPQYQGGQACLLHVDVPLSPNRLEQRIGRLDRFGAGSFIAAVAQEKTGQVLAVEAPAVRTGRPSGDRGWCSRQGQVDYWARACLRYL
jgi:hypothetical protein